MRQISIPWRWLIDRIGGRRQAPVVSVIIPTYNWSSVLRYAIQSVLWQTYPHFELLVIGDGCTDDTAKVVGSFRDPRIRWHNLPGNSGSQSAPNNVGLEFARGEFIAYLGHDDVWHPTHLAHLVRAMHANPSDLAYTLAEMIGPPGSNIRILTGLSASGRYEPGMGIPPSSFLHTRGMAEDIGGWKDFRSLALPPDVEFLVRAHEQGNTFTAVRELTAFKFNSAWRPNSYRTKPCHEQAEYMRRIQEEPDFLYREMLAIAAVSLVPVSRSFPEVPEPPTPRPLGWEVHQWRRIRGLESLA